MIIDYQSICNMKTDDTINIHKLTALMFNLCSRGKAAKVRQVVKRAYEELQKVNTWEDITRTKNNYEEA